MATLLPEGVRRVGYSNLMGRDEAGTLSRVKAAFAAFDPALARHHGRIDPVFGSKDHRVRAGLIGKVFHASVGFYSMI